MTGGGVDPKHGVFMGPWGDLGSQTQRGIIHYGLSPNRQKALGGAGHNAIFNTFRRSRGQFLYVVPPLVAAYLAMSWAIERNEYLNSKAGRAEYGDAAV